MISVPYESINSSPSNDEVLSHTYGHMWSRKSASIIFSTGNLIRLIAISFLIAHAVRGMHTKNVELLVFGVLNWADLTMRYPVAVHEPIQRWTIVVFCFMFLILTWFYAYGTIGVLGGTLLTIAATILSLIIFVGTKPVYETKRMHMA